MTAPYCFVFFSILICLLLLINGQASEANFPSHEFKFIMSSKRCSSHDLEEKSKAAQDCISQEEDEILEAIQRENKEDICYHIKAQVECPLTAGGDECYSKKRLNFILLDWTEHRFTANLEKAILLNRSSVIKHISECESFVAFHDFMRSMHPLDENCEFHESLKSAIVVSMCSKSFTTEYSALWALDSSSEVDPAEVLCDLRRQWEEKCNRDEHFHCLKKEKVIAERQELYEFTVQMAQFMLGLFDFSYEKSCGIE